MSPVHPFPLASYSVFPAHHHHVHFGDGNPQSIITLQAFHPNPRYTFPHILTYRTAAATKAPLKKHPLPQRCRRWSCAKCLGLELELIPPKVRLPSEYAGPVTDTNNQATELNIWPSKATLRMIRDRGGSLVPAIGTESAGGDAGRGEVSYRIWQTGLVPRAPDPGDKRPWHCCLCGLLV